VKQAERDRQNARALVVVDLFERHVGQAELPEMVHRPDSPRQRDPTTFRHASLLMALFDLLFDR
jgi:hypothetical protein